MSAPQPRLTTEVSQKNFEAQLEGLVADGAKAIFILACSSERWQAELVDNALRKCPIPVFGGVFPQIIVDGSIHNRGTAFIPLELTIDVSVIHRLSHGSQYIQEQLNDQSNDLLASRSLILVDGLTRNIERLVENLYNVCGSETTMVGGGAGSLDFVQKPCLFCNEGMLGDAALIARLSTPLYRGLSHGWQSLEGPYLVTRSNGNTLQELNYQPAFDIYRSSVEKNSPERFSEQDFFSIAKTFPLGIENIDGDLTVRDPIRVENKSLICVGEVPENATVFILKGEAKRLIDSAAQAAGMAAERFTEFGANNCCALLFDCISRALFLGDHFEQELKAIVDRLPANSSIYGALSLGEISNSARGPIELLNKSTVIGLVGK